MPDPCGSNLVSLHCGSQSHQSREFCAQLHTIEVLPWLNLTVHLGLELINKAHVSRIYSFLNHFSLIYQVDLISV